LTASSMKASCSGVRLMLRVGMAGFFPNRRPL
jgi:hypothetical protein